MPTRILIGILLCLAVSSGYAEDPPLTKEEEQAAVRLHARIFPNAPISHERVRQMTTEERELLLAYLRKIVERIRREGQTDASMVGSSIVTQMGLLGDDWAREVTVENFRENSRAAPIGLELLQDPKVIPMIGEGLFLKEVYEYHIDVGLRPTQTNVAMVILHTLSNSAEFNEETTAWAKRIGQDFTMQMMREWYRANEAALKAGDFKAVKPGRERADFPRSEPAPIILLSRTPGCHTHHFALPPGTRRITCDRSDRLRPAGLSCLDMNRRMCRGAGRHRLARVEGPKARQQPVAW